MRNTLESTLRRAAREHGGSIAQLARQSGVPYASLWGFLNDRSLAIESASKLAEALCLELRPKRRKRKG